MRYAITGGTGFVGRALCRELEASGHEVVPISRRTGVSIADVSSLEGAFDGCDGVVHCAGINRETRSQCYASVHVAGMRNVVAAARAAGVKKLVVMSFLRARPDCGSGYHESKWAAEEIARSSGVDFTIVKAGVVFGRGDHMLDHLSHSLFSFPIFGLVGMRAQLVRPTAVGDLARVLAAALTDPRLSHTTVPVTGPAEMTLHQAVRIVADVIERRPVFFRMPVLFHYALAWSLERVMKVPMISLAQVRILSESLVEASGEVDALPADLAPGIAFDEASVRRGLPAPRRFGWGDLELHACPR